MDTAFRQFLTTTVDPSSDTVTQALASRQRCLSQLGQLAVNVPDFPIEPGAIRLHFAADDWSICGAGRR